MAIYHNEVKIITRGEGRSACAASAYLSCSAIYNDYDGIQHDYTRKGGLVWEQVFLPPMAPEAWQDKEQLWNAVEAAEQSKESRLAREHIVALPVELNKDQWVSVLTEYIQTQFVDEGMCVHAAIHDTDGHNPHAHIMTTVRPLNPDGTWQNKTEKEYLCIRNGEERGFNAAEFKEARNDGWEKQYPYLVGKKKVYMPISEGEAHGYERTSKHPKNTRYGRQNPIAARWNSEEQLQQWRIAWDVVVNKHLERAGSEERIDHRSHADRGIDEHPTIHEGVAARILEKKGGISERCELNRQIRKDNQDIRYWKAVLEKLKQAAVKVTETAVDVIRDLAYRLESRRRDMIVGYYLLEHNDNANRNAEQYVARMEPILNEYMENYRKLKSAVRSRKELIEERDALSQIHVFQRRDLSDQITALETDIRKMKKAEGKILEKCGKKNHSEMKELQNYVTEVKSKAQSYPERRDKQKSIVNKTIQAIRELFGRTKDVDSRALTKERKAIRAKIEPEEISEIEKISGRKYSFLIHQQCKGKADRSIEDIEQKQKPRSKEKPSPMKNAERE